MLEEIALKYYNQGYNCAESIVLAGNEAYHLNLDAKSIRLFAAFGGGLQCGDLCGCLTGAAGIISALYVPNKAHDSLELRSYTQLLIREFEKELGARKCMDVKPRLFKNEIRCRNTIIHGARALESTIQTIDMKNIAK